jgi:hypothetical protein
MKLTETKNSLTMIPAKLRAVMKSAGWTPRQLSERIPCTVLPNGQNLGTWIKPQLESTYRNNQMPPMLGYEGKAS